MTSTPEAPALIQYACERCKTRFVLPPSSRGLSLAGKMRAFSMSVGRTVKFHEGLGAGYDTARRQLLAKMDDEAYQSFVQSFRFCHECRQFVCNECWSTSRRSCLTCVAKSMTGTARPRPPFAPTGPEIPRPVVAAVAPRKGRLRRDMAIVALAIAVVLVSIEGGVLLVGAAGGTGTPTPTPTEFAAVVSPSASASPSLAPTDTPSAAPTDSPSPSLTITPAPAPKPTPVPPLFTPTISSSSCSNASGGSTTCNIGNKSKFKSTDTFTWSFDGSTATKHGPVSVTHPAVCGTDIFVTVSRSGTKSVASAHTTPC
jgi:hypothetical protein